MFIKIVIILLLVIVAASLLGGRARTGPGQPAGVRRSTLRPLMLRIAAVLLAIGTLLAILHLTGCSQKAQPFHATDISGAEFARLSALEALSDHRSRRIASADFKGKAVVVFFGYTQCPDICPTTLSAMKEVMQLLGPEADRVQVLFVSVDPERDTQEVLANYVPWFDSRFLGLQGSVAATTEIAREFRVFYAKVTSKEGGSAGLNYSLDHSATSFAYDTEGRPRLLIRHGETPGNIAADLKILLAEK